MYSILYTYLRSVAHVGRELYEATVALKVFRVPGLFHGSHAVLTLTEYFLTIINGFTNILLMAIYNIAKPVQTIT